MCKGWKTAVQQLILSFVSCLHSQNRFTYNRYKEKLLIFLHFKPSFTSLKKSKIKNVKSLKSILLVVAASIFV